MDNCTAHTAGTLDIANVEVKFLPPNTTSKLQPLDGGIIRTLKAHYRRRQALRTLEQFNRVSQSELGKQLDILDAINMMVPAWEVDVSATTIANCWKHCGLTGSTTQRQMHEVNEAISDLEDVLMRIGYEDAIPAQELVDYNGEEEICEVQTEEEFFANLHFENSVTEKEEDKDNSNECPHYTFQQVREAMEVLQGFALQKGDENGEGRKAIDLYRRYYSVKLIQASHQTYLIDLFAKKTDD